MVTCFTRGAGTITCLPVMKIEESPGSAVTLRGVPGFRSENDSAAPRIFGAIVVMQGRGPKKAQKRPSGEHLFSYRLPTIVVRACFPQNPKNPQKVSQNGTSWCKNHFRALAHENALLRAFLNQLLRKLKKPQKNTAVTGVKNSTFARKHPVRVYFFGCSTDARGRHPPQPDGSC